MISFAKKTTNQREIGPNVVSLPEGSPRTGESVTSVSFATNTAYWRGAPAISGIECMVYSSTAAVAAAIHSGVLDVAYGVNSVDVGDFLGIRANHSTRWSTHIGGPINTRLVAINSNASVTSSLSVRRAIVALVNRDKLVSGPLGGLERAATTVFPVDLPYCNVPLTPVPAYDPEKAALLLSADGWTPGSNGIRAKSGQVLSVKMVTLDCESPHPRTPCPAFTASQCAHALPPPQPLQLPT
jgi:ABC-type transport system substrate-binding protein